MLAIPPDTIRLGSLVQRLEAGQALVECNRPDGCTCTLLPDCRLRGMLGDAQNQFYTRLDMQTLADCLRA